MGITSVTFPALDLGITGWCCQLPIVEKKSGNNRRVLLCLSSRCASFTKRVAKAQKYEPSRERYRGKEALFKSFVHKIRGGGGRAAKKKQKPKKQTQNK